MPSRRHKYQNRPPPRAPSPRSRSPPRGNTRQSSSNRDYRVRDDDNKRRQHGYNNSSHNGYQNPSRSQGGYFTEQNPQITYNITNYNNIPPASAQMGNRGRRGDDHSRSNNRGRSRGARYPSHERARASETSHSTMQAPPTRAPPDHTPWSQRDLPSRAQRDASSRDNRPSTDNHVKLNIPEALRDRCGACKEGHDIRFCPHPSTEDSRTKICPICDNSLHPWYLCSHYDKKDTELQWDICWENRRGLPTMVHDNSLHKIFLKKLNLEDEDSSFEDRIRLINRKAGPLSPAFVKRLMPPLEHDDCVQQQLRNGRQLPWHLYKEVLESPTKRHNRVIEDPATVNMQVGNFIPGTNTTDVPKAHKQKYLQLLNQNERDRKDRQITQQNSDVSRQMTGLQLGLSQSRAGVGRPSPLKQNDNTRPAHTIGGVLDGEPAIHAMFPSLFEPAGFYQNQVRDMKDMLEPVLPFLQSVSPCHQPRFWWPDRIADSLWALFALKSWAARQLEWFMQKGRAEPTKWYCAMLAATGTSLHVPGILDQDDRCASEWCKARGHCLQVSLAEAEFRMVRLRCVRFDLIQKSAGISS